MSVYVCVYVCVCMYVCVCVCVCVYVQLNVAKRFSESLLFQSWTYCTTCSIFYSPCSNQWREIADIPNLQCIIGPSHFGHHTSSCIFF